MRKILLLGMLIGSLLTIMIGSVILISAPVLAAQFGSDDRGRGGAFVTPPTWESGPLPRSKKFPRTCYADEVHNEYAVARIDVREDGTVQDAAIIKSSRNVDRDEEAVIVATVKSWKAKSLQGGMPLTRPVEGIFCFN